MSAAETDTSTRVSNSVEVIGHAHNLTWANSSMEGAEEAAERLPVREGVHYDVLASTMWGDYHQPTVVRWADGTTDSFTDLEESKANRAAAIEEVSA